MRLWTAILAGLQIFSAGSILTEVFPVEYVGLFSLAVGALQGGTIFYMKGTQAPDQVGRHRIDEGT
jgi:hypothetical protein